MSSHSILGLGFLAVLALGCAPHESGSSMCMSPSQAQEVLDTNWSHHGTYIVKFKKNSKAQAEAGFANSLNAQKLNDRLTSLRTSRSPEEFDAVSEYIRSGDIEFIEPDYELYAVDDGLENYATAVASKQWAHQVVDSEQAWALTRGNPAVTVGVIDTGIDPTHKDLKNALWKNTREIPNNGIDDDKNGYVDDTYGWNFVGNNNSPIADDTRSYHGTHVSGTIAGARNDAAGTSGEAPQIKIMTLKYLNSSASGVTSNAIRAIDYAIANGARILSNSWGSFHSSAALENAIARAQRAGILFVAAAGNGDSSGHGVNLDKTNFYPAGYPESNVVSVAASNSSDQLASWSNFGLSRVDLAAPGVNIYSTRNGDRYAYLSGTSMATPLVSGVAALILSARPDFNYRQVKESLLAGVERIGSMNGRVYSGGRINAYKSLLYAKNYSAQIPPSSENPALDPEADCQ